MTSLRLPNTISSKANPKSYRLHAQSTIPLSTLESPPSIYPTHFAPLSIAAIFNKAPVKRSISFSQLSTPPVRTFTTGYKGNAWKLQDPEPHFRTNTEESPQTGTSTPKESIPNIKKGYSSHRSSTLPQSSTPSYFATRFNSKLTTPDVRTPCLTEAPTPRSGFSPRNATFRADIAKLLKGNEGFNGFYNSAAPTRKNSNPKLEEMLAIIQKVPTVEGASHVNPANEGELSSKLNSYRFTKRKVYKKSLFDDIQTKASETPVTTARMLQTSTILNRVQSDKLIGMNMELGARGARRVIFTEAKDAYNEDYGLKRKGSHGGIIKPILRLGSSETINLLSELGDHNNNLHSIDSRFRYTEDDVQHDKMILGYMNFKEPEISNIKLAESIKEAHPLGYVKISTQRSEKSPPQMKEKHHKEIIMPACSILHKQSNKQRLLASRSHVPASRGEQLIEILKSKLDRLRRLKLTLREVMTEKVFSTAPYERKGAREFIEAAKHGNLKKMEKMMDYASKYLVYDYDHVYQTALHFAAKRGYYHVGAFLINLGADVDARDMTGRTPLYFAIKNKHYDLIELLLANGADPWPTEDYNYGKLINNDKEALKLITRAKEVYVIIKMANEVIRLSLWRKTNFVDITRIILSRDERLNPSRDDKE